LQKQIAWDRQSMEMPDPATADEHGNCRVIVLDLSDHLRIFEVIVNIKTGLAFARQVSLSSIL
jgi:hypothetical protein